MPERRARGRKPQGRVREPIGGRAPATAERSSAEQPKRMTGGHATSLRSDAAETAVATADAVAAGQRI
jgi:hypothetical protein